MELELLATVAVTTAVILATGSIGGWWRRSDD
jgi:hypothetical protein